MAVYQALLLNTVVPQIQAAQAGDSYVMVVNATTPALRITQTGTGDAILVEDSANPDATPFVVLAAGDVGIGTSSPAYKLDVAGTARFNNTFDFGAGQAISSGSGSYRAAKFGAASGAFNVLFSGSTSFQINDSADTTNLLVLTNSGNLGLGVTPSAWASGIKAFELANTSVFGSSQEINVTSNAYYSASGWKRITAAAASAYQQNAGAHFWQTAGSSTADSAISFTQAMTLDASGKLGVGTTSPGALLDVNSGGVTAYASPAANFFRNHGAQAYSNLGGLQLYWNTSDGSGESEIVYGNLSTSYLRFIQNNAGSFTERARITSGGNLNFGNSSANRATTAGTAVINIFNGTAPVGTLANGISLYSSSGEAYVMDAAGNATLFSPHDSETNEWIFKSKHTPSGKVLKIDVEKMLRFINDHFGLDAIHEFTEE